jgi:hypothetical protein
MPTTSDRELYNELAYYTLAHGDKEFIHQYVVDAYIAQHADEKTKPIAITFALVGLYLHAEKNHTGREVQLAHTKMAKERKDWPRFELPEERGTTMVADVLRVKPGPERDQAIRDWVKSTWAAWQNARPQIIALAKKELGF